MMTIRKSIKDSHESYPYNRNMAQALYRSMWLENWGSGANRIIEACREQGVEEPTWRWDGGFIYVTFKRPSKDSTNTPKENLGGDLAPSIQESKGESSPETLSKRESIQEMGSSTLESIQETPQSIQKAEKSIQESIQDLKSNREKVIYILSKNSKITLEEIGQIVGLSRIGIQKIVGKLKSEGILSRRGSTKSGEWIVTDKH